MPGLPFLLSACKIESMSRILSSYQHVKLVEIISGVLSSFSYKVEIMPGILSSYQYAQLRLCQESLPNILCKVEIMSRILSSYQLQSWDYARNPFRPISMQSWDYMSEILSSYQLQSWDYVRNPFILSACKAEIMSGILSSYQHAKLRLCQESFPPLSMQSWDYARNPFIQSAAKLRLCQESIHPISCKVEIMSGILSSNQLQNWVYVRNPFLLLAAMLRLCQDLSSYQHAKLRLWK